MKELQKFKYMGVETFSCGTCLDYYQLKDKPAVGEATNIYDTVEAFLFSPKCITLSLIFAGIWLCLREI